MKRIMELLVEEPVKVLDLLPRDTATLTVSGYNDILSVLARVGDHATAIVLLCAMPIAPEPSAQPATCPTTGRAPCHQCTSRHQPRPPP